MCVTIFNQGRGNGGERQDTHTHTRNTVVHSCKPSTQNADGSAWFEASQRHGDSEIVSRIAQYRVSQKREKKSSVTFKGRNSTKEKYKQGMINPGGIQEWKEVYQQWFPLPGETPSHFPIAASNSILHTSYKKCTLFLSPEKGCVGES